MEQKLYDFIKVRANKEIDYERRKHDLEVQENIKFFRNDTESKRKEGMNSHHKRNQTA